MQHILGFNVAMIYHQRINRIWSSLLRESEVMYNAIILVGIASGKSRHAQIVWGSMKKETIVIFLKIWCGFVIFLNNKKLHFILRTVSTYHAQTILRETPNSTGNQCPCSKRIHEHEATMKWALYLLPNMNRSKLLLKWYSYIKKLSGPSTLHPSNFTKFLWRTWLITSTSLKNWSIHCFVFRNSLFAATSFPPGRIACRSNNYYLWVQAIWSLAGCNILVQLYCKNVQLKWGKNAMFYFHVCTLYTVPLLPWPILFAKSNEHVAFFKSL